MFKKILIFISFIILCSIAFSEDVKETKSGNGMTFSGFGGLGIGVIDNGEETKGVLKLNLDPEFGVGNLKIGLKLAIFIGEEGLADVNNDGKNNEDDLEFGVRYIGWEGKNIQFRYGSLDEYVLGHGSLVYNYSNNDKTSLRFGLSHSDKIIGMEAFFPLKKDILWKSIDKKERPGAMGARIYARPLKRSNDEDPLFIDDFEIGATYIEDTREKFYNHQTTNGAIETYINDDGENIPVEYNGKIYGSTVELSLPLIENTVVPYYNYAILDGELAGKKKKANGHFLGVMGRVTSLNYKVEYRNITENFTPGYMGRFYESNYSEVLDTLIYGNKSDRINGIFGDLTFKVSDMIDWQVSYEDYFSGELKPHVLSSLKLKPSSDIIANFTYEQINVGSGKHKDDFLNDDTYIKGELVVPAVFIGIPGPFLANINIKQTYHYDEDNGKYEPTREYTVGLGVKW